MIGERLREGRAGSLYSVFEALARRTKPSRQLFDIQSQPRSQSLMRDPWNEVDSKGRCYVSNQARVPLASESSLHVTTSY